MTESIRSAVSMDIERLVAIDGSVNPSPWSADRFHQMTMVASPETMTTGVAAACRILVAEIERRVVGFIVVSWVLDEGEIQNLGVDPAEQGKGIGLVLVNDALDLLCRDNIGRCCLEVRDSNRKARGLYEKCGFIVDGVREKYYPSDTGREDAVLMSRDIDGEVSERT